MFVAETTRPLLLTLNAVALLVALALVVAIIVMGFRTYDGTMRMVSTNSRAISAACHALLEDRESGYLLPVQWGVVEMKEGVGKVAFTTAPADKMRDPIPGKLYK